MGNLVKFWNFEGTKQDLIFLQIVIGCSSAATHSSLPSFVGLPFCVARTFLCRGDVCDISWLYYYFPASLICILIFPCDALSADHERGHRDARRGCGHSANAPEAVLLWRGDASWSGSVLSVLRTERDWGGGWVKYFVPACLKCMYEDICLSVCSLSY